MGPLHLLTASGFPVALNTPGPIALWSPLKAGWEMLILNVVPTETLHPEASVARVGRIVQSTLCSGQITAPCPPGI